ncbi:S9 family peptidase [Chitinophaga varians]|uniref:S9 family peptidase n=1 Tax=Chitinophaga varians TaxID=2202339 RepID=A0A847S5I0_9BACT|nr:prolyl oligopeptidase family serine peptidase [Chitinophaga varians]NLR66841.1 S9 family peptidase [Chitinophaga varians]
MKALLLAVKKNIICAIFILYLLLMYSFLYAQKKTLDINDLESWVSVRRGTLSANGKYTAFYKGDTNLVVKNVQSSWNKELNNPLRFLFTSDSKFLVCQHVGGRISIVSLGKDRIDEVSSVRKFFVMQSEGKEYILYLRTDGQFVVAHLDGDLMWKVDNVSDFWVQKDRGYIFYKSRSDSGYFELKKMVLNGRDPFILYRGNEPVSVALDNSGSKIAFLVISAGEKSLWYYSDSISAKAVKKDLDLKLDGYDIGGLDEFSEDGNLVFGWVKDKPNLNESNKSKTLVYSFASPRLSVPDYSGRANKYLAVWNLKDERFFKVQNRGEMLYFKAKNNMALLRYSGGDVGEWNWNGNARSSCVLVDLKNGLRSEITNGPNLDARSYILSPMGKWIVYYDSDSSDYFSYHVGSGERRRLTRNVDAVWTSYDNDDIPSAKYYNIGIGGFSSDESKLYLYDQYDIFVVDLKGDNEPFCLTGGYGRRNNIVFRFAFPPNNQKNKKVILTAFSRKTKEDGFYSIEESKRGEVKKLVMDAAIFTGPEESKYVDRLLPVKADSASVYLVRKMNATSSPNFYVTRDFVNFESISNVYPEKKYNWLTSELVRFKTLDGKDADGILFKPENFDPNKKYPLIFYYYEKISETLHFYWTPGPCEGPINIPYFVSNGYLVFVPDIHFTIGYPGRSSFSTIMGAADKLVKLSYVDSTKMGLQGHSFGGFQTNYIVTHTQRFAAACSAAGFTNFVSAYGSIIGNGYSRQGQFELSRDRIGATLWERPDLYLENSPVMRVNQVSTPMLIMHNNGDDDVLVTQGVEFFTGLRRLGKISYWLQYEGARHSVYGNSALDYSAKMMGFFNYYLKGEKIPSWMCNKSPNILSVNKLLK